MNLRKEIEVGKIEPQIFQLYCIKAIQLGFGYRESNGGNSTEASRNVDTHIYIDIVNPTGIRVTLTNSFPVTDIYYFYNITYKDDFIIIQCEADYETKGYISIEERNAYINDTEELINAQQRILTDILLSSFSLFLKKHSEIHKIPIYFKPVFNPITCFNTTSNQIENIRLTPHGSIKNINKPQLYDSIQLRERKMEFVASDKGEYCISADRDIYDNGSVFELGNTKIKRLIQTGHSETWLPLCSLIADTNIKINTPLYVKPKDSEEGVWLYIAINGIIYGDTIIKAAMEYKVIEAEKGPIELIIYKDKNQEILLPLVANELLLIRGNELTKPIALDIERVVEVDILDSDSEEFANLKANIEKLNNSLIDRNYYDGTKFEELLTYQFLQIKREEERKAKREAEMAERRQRQKEEMQASVKEGIDKFKQFTNKVIGQTKQVTNGKVDQIRQQNDSTLGSNPNEKKSGGFNEYYQKHKTSILIAVGLIFLLLVSTCI